MKIITNIIKNIKSDKQKDETLDFFGIKITLDAEEKKAFLNAKTIIEESHTITK